MRLTDSLTLPDEVEQARATGKLVVFAGAGVSMGPPALLPSFVELAREIAEGTIPWDDEFKAKLDYYLGRAESAGVLIQERARRALISDRPHNRLHEHLIGIFRSPSDVRLITTNFDGHFTSAAEAVFRSATVPLYTGPALPPGDAFRGIIELHGSLRQEYDRLILTDVDFAGAYMAEGWASRFLVRAFTGRTVLFVGYSLADPLMRYLIRAIPPSGSWYALRHEGGQEIEEVDHPVAAIHYSTRGDGEKHGELSDAFERWHWHVTAEPSDHDQELRRLLELGVPTSPRDADYIRNRLGTLAGREAFARHARSEEWFDWVVEEGFLDRLTDPEDRAEDTPFWAAWCLDHFCAGDTPRLLRFLRGRPLSLQPWFAAALARHLAVRKPLPPRPVTRQLVAIVASQPPARTARYDVEWLLGRLFEEGLFEEIVVLLRALTRVQLEPADPLFLRFEEDEAHGSDQAELRPFTRQVGINSNADDLIGFLTKHGKALAASVAEDLVALGVSGIEEAYGLLDAARGLDESFDWLSYGRTAIADTSQDRVGRGVDVFVALARTSLDYISSTAPAQLTSLSDSFSRSGRTLIRRLALYGYAQCNECSADDVLRLAIRKRWASDPLLRPEFYRLLKTHFPRASKAAVGEFLAAVADNQQWGDERLDDHAAHARFSLSQMLVRLTPESGAAIAFAEAERAANPDFAEGDRDGYLSRVTVGWGGGEPAVLAVEDALGSTPEAALAQLLDESGEDRRRVLSIAETFRAAALADPRWGIAVFDLAVRGPTPSAEAAKAVLRGLHEASVDRATQTEFLDRLQISELPAVVVQVASLIDRWSRIEAPVDDALLDAIDRVADMVYEHARELESGLVSGSWSDLAINHPAGKAAQVWWRVADARDFVDGEFVISVDEREKARWLRVCRDDDASADHARPILGMITNRLTGSDYPWSVENIFPAFDLSQSLPRASQLWDGRLSHHTWSWSVVEALGPYLKAFLRRSAEVVPKRAEQLGGWMAFLVANPNESGVTVELLRDFVAGGSPKARVSFAQSIPQSLGSLSEGEVQQIWRQLILPYWRDRQTNVPEALAPAEVAAMVPWVEVFESLESEVLAELKRSPGQGFEHMDHVLWQWRQDGSWLETHPTVGAEVVAFLASRDSIPPWSTDYACEVIEKALEGGADALAVRAAAQHLVRLGSQRAATLVARITEDQ